jgi:hypothetical protein
MRRVASVWAAAVGALAVAGCGDGRSAAAPAGDESGCASCHSGPGEAPPFRDFTGSTDPARLTVGSHDPHLHGSLSAPISCSECHTVPRSVDDPGHLQDSPGDIRFGRLARTGGTTPSYTPPSCHGAFPGGNAANTPRWAGGPGQAACGTCHATPPPSGRHAEHLGQSSGGVPITCNTCHGPLVQATHVNGVKNVVLPAWNAQSRSCAQACHEPRSWEG